MKRLIVLFLALILVTSFIGCNTSFISEEPIKYTCDLSEFPTDNDCRGYGKVIEVAKGKLLIEPGSDEDKIEYGDVVWLICDEAESYDVGQVVTYIFRDIKAPDKKGNPLNIIALLVYME